MNIKFYYGKEADQYSFFKIWLDDENKVFIIFTIDKIEETMNIGRNKAINIMKEIQDFGLIEKKRRRLDKPKIALMNLIIH